MRGLPERRGLSPPTRGNLSGGWSGRADQRSIPAHAGEPPRRVVFASEYMVYPRPRGGTRKPPRPLSAFGGLSPPTRGNPASIALIPLTWWSIPAHAGEPGRRGRRGLGFRVYPRPRGGTPIPPCAEVGVQGLSPPTRGNPGRKAVRREIMRSIPAHAGEPGSRDSAQPRDGVYPRPRGGTLGGRRRYDGGDGLSPPTRGNQSPPSMLKWTRRSIPAHAGEPDSARTRRRTRAVYPRPRGGTS